MAVADTHFVPRVKACGPDSPEQSTCRERVEDVVHGVPADAGNDGADRIEDAIGIGTFPGAAPDNSLWWRHERLHRCVARDPNALMPLYSDERDACEASWLSAPPQPQEAWNEGARLLERWTRAVEARTVMDRRPGFVRRYWARRACGRGC